MKRLSPVTRIAFGLSCVSVSLILVAATLGWVPDPRAALTAKRRAVAETLAVDCSLFTSQGSLDNIRTSLRESVHRDPDLLQARLRRTDDSVWLEVPPATEVPQAAAQEFRVSVPIVAGKRRWGALELDYRPAGRRGLLALASHPIVGLVTILGSLSFLAFYFYLRTTLQYLDPSKVMPARVRQTLDTIAGGLMVVDNQERIVHTNEAFSRLVGKSDIELRGRRASKLRWQAAEDSEVDVHPWTKAIQSGVFETGVKLSLEVKGLGNRTFLVNTSSILDDQGQARGALVSFDDVTALEASRVELRKMLNKLKQSRDEIQRQNQELEQIANLDPLTSCLNRRAFYREFETLWNISHRYGNPLSVLMIDVDHFKSINDRHGHSVGDKMLQHVAQMIRSIIRDSDLLCRYGGEEFCVLLPETEIEGAGQLAERCRQAIEHNTCQEIAVTASLGVSACGLGAHDPHRLLDQADEAMYAAKNGGRNRVIRWDEACQKSSSSSRELEPPSPADPQDVKAAHIPFPAVSALTSALSFRDPETAEHCRRVTDLCILVAQELMSPSEVYVLETAALLHDIGKIGIPDSVLGKPGRLNPQEWEIMKRHDEIGVTIIQEACGSEQLTALIGAHHAWYLGNPDHPSLPSGEDIPLGARILAIAEAFDAMVSGSVYQPARSREQAFDELCTCAGTQFDPQLVERFIAEVTARDANRRRPLGNTSREMVASMVGGADDLTSALEKQDAAAAAGVAQRLQRVAQLHQATELQQLAEQLEQVASEEGDLVKLAATAGELLELCQRTQRDYLNAREGQKSSLPEEPSPESFSNTVTTST